MLQSGRISYSRRNPGAVEIGTETDAVLSHALEHVFEVIDHELGGRIAIRATVGAEETGGEVDPDHAAGSADRGQLLVGQIA
jgi:hypothetical protein